MIEIFQIFLFLTIFTLTLLVPLNLFQYKPYFKNLSILEKSAFNLTLNLNFLLFISFLNFSVKSLQPILLTIYILLFLFHYYNKLILLKKFLVSIFPLFLIFFILSINISTELFLGWDAKFFYYIKALFFFEGKNIFDLNKFSHNVWHPYFGSYLWGFFWNISITETEYYGRLFYLFLFCYSFFLISQIENNQKINTLIFFLLIIIFYEYKFFSGLQEILIFSFLLLISKFFDKIIAIKDHIFLVIIILLSNLFIWIKSEGIIYFVMSFLMILLIKKISYKSKFFVFLSLAFLYLIKLFIYEIANFDINSQSTFYNLNYFLNLELQTIINKLGYIIIWLGYYLLTNIFFPIFILLIILEKFYSKNWKKDTEYNKLLYFYLFYILVFIFSAYILRDMEIVQSIRTTMDRIVMTASGFLVYPSIKKIFNNLKLKKLIK